MRQTDGYTMIEALLEREVWVIDALPRQVPANSAGQFFAIEHTLLTPPRSTKLRKKFVDVLLRLNCYVDFDVWKEELDGPARNPAPDELERWVEEDREALSIVLSGEDALIVVPTESTCMALHNAAPDLLSLITCIAQASGLFVWKPPADDA